MRSDDSAGARRPAPRDTRRLVGPVLATVALLAVVAATAGALRSRSLGADPLGSDLGVSVLDARWSQNVVVAVLAVAALASTVAGVWMVRIRAGRGAERDAHDEDEGLPALPWWRRALAVVAPVVLVVLVIVVVARRGEPPPTVEGAPPPPGVEERGTTPPAPPVDWWFVGLVVVLSVGAAVVASRRWAPMVLTARARREGPYTDDLLDAVDDSLDALMAEPDHRRAVVAAYARMERLLARAGVPRAQAEAPYEYLHRVLREAGVHAETAGTLTGLFERARFSPHPVGPTMRAEAVACLLALREELAGDHDRPAPADAP